MRGLTIGQYVAAPIERVYATYVDPALMPRWMELQAVSDLSGPLDRAGTRFTQVVFGWWWRFRTEVLRAEPPILHEMAGRAPLWTSYRWLTRYAPEGEGTRITLETGSRAFGALDPFAEPTPGYARRPRGGRSKKGRAKGPEPARSESQRSVPVSLPRRRAWRPSTRG